VSLYVVDVSVAAKWCLPSGGETLVQQALDCLDRYGKGQVQFVVPDLFWAELGNILWKAVRAQRCTQQDAAHSIAQMKGREFPTVSSQVLLEQAFIIATTFQRTVYDAIYVALAVDSNAQLLTADEKLANALRQHLPVKWLGAL